MACCGSRRYVSCHSNPHFSRRKFLICHRSVPHTLIPSQINRVAPRVWLSVPSMPRPQLALEPLTRLIAAALLRHDPVSTSGRSGSAGVLRSRSHPCIRHNEQVLEKGILLSPSGQVDKGPATPPRASAKDSGPGPPPQAVVLEIQAPAAILEVSVAYLRSGS